MAVVACVVALASSPDIANAQRIERQPTAGGVVPGEVIVRFESGTTSQERLAARRAADVRLDRSLRLPLAQVVDAEGSVRQAVLGLERQPGVAYAQPNYVYRALAVDTFFGDLWGLEDPAPPNPGVGALDAWETSRGAGQVIAVVDTGIAFDHPDLTDNLWLNPGETPGGGDDDGNGHGDDVHGYDFVDDDPDPDDYNFHGTHVAGTAAAEADNGLGIAGVAPEARVMAVRVLDGDGSGSSATIGDGIEYAAVEGADVINMSLGGGTGPGDHFMSDAIDLAAAHDVVVAVAAGNDGADNDAEPTVPCTFPQANLVCVAAVQQSGALASFSNRGATTVDVGAPGTNVLSAKADYAALYTESFSSGLGAWTKPVANGGVAWGSHPVGSDGNPSATDSPGGAYGNAIDPDDPAESQLVKTTALSLVGRKGCRMHFDLGYEIEEGFDELLAGAVGVGQDTLAFTGSTGGFFEATEVSISDLDGQASVRPAFALFSDESVADDGAYVDDLRLLCRDSTYLDDKTAGGNYVGFSGTSMATPHVAGVAALVRAAAPGISAEQAVAAIERGGVPLASLTGKTATGCTVDAAGAIAIALGGPDPDRCPVAPAPPAAAGQSSPAVVTPTALPPSGPAKPDLRRARGRIRVTSGGRFAYRFKATHGLSGKVTFRTLRKLRVSRVAKVALAGPRFSVTRADGRVTLAVKLTRPKLRLLRRHGRLAVTVRATVRNAAGLTATATRRLVLLAPRR